MQIRKMEKDLTITDLLQYPAWEYALDEETVKGQSEKTLRPYIEPPPLDPNASYLIVRTTFTLANGFTRFGFIKIASTRRSKLLTRLIPYDLDPVILTDLGIVFFCYGPNRPNKTKLSENYKRLGFLADDVFPMRFSADIEIINGVSQGDLMGFMSIRKNVTNFYQLQPSDIVYTQ